MVTERALAGIYSKSINLLEQSDEEIGLNQACQISTSFGRSWIAFAKNEGNLNLGKQFNKCNYLYS